MDKVELAKKRWNMHILYVDDNIYMRQTLKNMLYYLGYPNTIAANDGEDAWTFMMNEKIDMVIVDFDMPRMNGVELLMKVRAEKNLRRMPFILFSGMINKEYIQLAGEADVDAILMKPFDMNILRETIIKNFEANAKPSREKELFWEGLDAADDFNLPKLESIISSLEALSKEGVQIKEFNLYLFKAHYSMITGEYEKVRDVLLSALEKNPHWVQFYEIIANSYLNEMNYAEAYNFFKMAVDISPAKTERIIKALELAEKANDNEGIIHMLGHLEKKVAYLPEETLVKIFTQYEKLQEWDKIKKLFIRITKEKKDEKLPFMVYKCSANAFVNLNDYLHALDIYSIMIKTMKKKGLDYPMTLLDYANAAELGKNLKLTLGILKKIDELFHDFSEQNSIPPRIEHLKKYVQE